MDKNLFINELVAKGINLDVNKLDLFNRYFEFLVNENKKYNLTALTSIDDVYEKHFYDSLSLLFNHNLEGSVIDVGSGGGFPSMPLKIVNPSLDLTVFDATAKKIEFIEKLSTLLNLDVKTICARAEEYKGSFDYVLARGVAPLNILLELVANLVKKDGVVIAMKGSKYNEELDEAKDAIKTLGYKLIKEETYTLPNENSLHCNLYFKKVKDHDLKYPRNYGRIKKKPL